MPYLRINYVKQSTYIVIYSYAHCSCDNQKYVLPCTYVHKYLAMATMIMLQNNV